MPKSKKRKNRYVPKPRTVQQSASPISTQPVERPVQQTSTVIPAQAKISRTPEKVQVIPQTSVGTELKVISLVTIVLLASIVVLYFIFR